MPIAEIIDALQLAAQLEPTIAALVPLVTQALNGQQFNDTDLANLKAAADAIDAAVAAKVAAQTGAASPSS